MTINIQDIITQLITGRNLSRQEARDLFEAIMTGRIEPEAMGEFLVALADKGETVDEIAGAADVMNEKVTPVRCEVTCIDTCGTGGDGISTFNVSTTAAIIAAAAGAVVAKHGNRTHTRVSGSAEAIVALGVNLDADVPTMERCLRECNIAFMYAPNLHPAMKYAGPVRKKLGIRTIFNLLGPLTNPAGAKRQILGVAKPALVELLAGVLAARGTEHSWVIHGHDGLCDLTITGPTQIAEVRHGRVETFTVHPRDLGLETAPLETLLVHTPQESADAIRAILSGKERGPRRDHALLNAAAALVVADVAENIALALPKAIEAVDSGAAQETLQKLAEISNQ
jgi:anthranilate phosphoribosyltransferase